MFKINAFLQSKTNRPCTALQNLGQTNKNNTTKEKMYAKVAFIVLHCMIICLKLQGPMVLLHNQA